MTSSSLHASRGPAQQQNPNSFQTRKKNSLFGWKSYGQAYGPFSNLFFIIIIYSQYIDNAPTQTLQGISHSARTDAAVPQIVQTTGQSPGPHNSLSGENGEKNLTLTLLNTYFREIAARDTVHPLWIWVGFDSTGERGTWDIWIWTTDPSTTSTSGYFYKASGSLWMLLNLQNLQ